MKNIFVDLLLKVETLIDSPKRAWNLDKLKDLFYSKDVHLILVNKPVVSKDDFWCWMHTRNGDYSAKSGYWLINQLNNLEITQEADMKPSLNDLKTQVWSLKTSTKIKSFLWRALSGALAVADRLEIRGLSKDLRCQFCGQEKESINHVLFSCSIARQIWALSDYPTPNGGFSHGSVFSNFHYLLSLEKNQNLPKHIRMNFPWILWSVWKNRNGFFFEGKSFVAIDLVNKIKEEAAQWFNAQVIGHRMDSSRIFDRGKLKTDWTCPPSSWLKCNVGMCWSKKNKVGGYSWVLRDENGLVLLHSRRSFSGIATLAEANFQGLMWAIESMNSHKISKVIFASEALELVKAINRPQAWPSFQFYISEINNGLIGINDWKIQSEKRSSNTGAFLIAQSVIQDKRFQSYVAQGFPFWLKELFDFEKRSSLV